MSTTTPIHISFIHLLLIPTLKLWQLPVEILVGVIRSQMYTVSVREKLLGPMDWRLFKNPALTNHRNRVLFMGWGLTSSLGGWCRGSLNCRLRIRLWGARISIWGRECGFWRRVSALRWRWWRRRSATSRSRPSCCRVWWKVLIQSGRKSCLSCRITTEALIDIHNTISNNNKHSIHLKQHQKIKTKDEDIKTNQSRYLNLISLL